MHEIKEKTYNNGCRLFYIQCPGEDMSVIASINAGPLYEDKTNYGISHLIEHILFKGTAKRESRDTIYNELGLLGGEDFCYTDTENVALGIRVIKDDFDAALDLMSDVLYSARMDLPEIEKEKQIVLSEIRDRNDRPGILTYEKFEQELFKGCQLMHPAIGYEHIVNGLNPEDVAKFYKQTFTPGNTTIFVAGSMPFEETEARINSYFGRIPSANPGNKAPEIILPSNEKRRIIVPRDLDNVYLMMGRIVPHSMHEDHYALKILGQALSRSVSERILNQEPISYDRWVYYSSKLHAGSIMTYATADIKHYDKLVELILDEWTKYSKGIIPDSFITDAKKKMQKKFVLENSSTMNKATSLMTSCIKGDVNRINTEVDSINQVTIDQVKEAARNHIKLDDLLLLSVGRLQ